MNAQPDMFQDITYPFRAGSRGGETSEQAAKDMQPRLAAAQQQVYHAVKHAGGLAAFELVKYCHPLTHAAAQPRLPELEAMGLLKATDERRVNPATGKSQKVWRLA